MEQLLAAILGIVGAWIQGDAFKTWFSNEKTRIRIRFALSLLVSVFAGFLTTFFTNELKPKNEFSWVTLLGNAGFAFTASQTYYNTYFRLKK